MRCTVFCLMLCAAFSFTLYRADSKPFVVGTYHMPCMFKVPSVMMIHCALSAQHIHKYANNDPYVLVGDFNIKPGVSLSGPAYSYPKSSLSFFLFCVHRHLISANTLRLAPTIPLPLLALPYLAPPCNSMLFNAIQRT